jgi:AcrR family transcriptional regulator
VPKHATTDAQKARRRRVVDAGMELLRERDYEKIQMKDVAEAADVALGTVYNYFASKEHLFAEVLIAWAATLGTNISRHPLRGRTDRERLTEVFHRSVRAFQRQPSLARLIATLETSSDPFATEILGRLGHTTNAVYTAALRDVAPAEAERIVRVVSAVLASSLRPWAAGRAPVQRVYDDLEDAISLLVD